MKINVTRSNPIGPTPCKNNNHSWMITEVPTSNKKIYVCKVCGKRIISKR